MKKYPYFLMMLVLAVGCDDERVSPEENVKTGNLVVAFPAEDLAGGSLEELSAMSITIKDDDGNVVIDKELSVTNIDDDQVTEPLSLPPGNYVLTQFSGSRKKDGTFCEAPVHGSETAERVDRPLPVSFTINSDLTTSLSLNVITRECKGLGLIDDNDLVCFGNRGTNYIIAYSSVDGRPSVLNLRLTTDDGSFIVIETNGTIHTGTYAIKTFEEFRAANDHGTYGYFLDNRKGNSRAHYSVSGWLFIESIKYEPGTSGGWATGAFTMTVKEENGNARKLVNGGFHEVRGMGWLEE